MVQEKSFTFIGLFFIMGIIFSTLGVAAASDPAPEGFSKEWLHRKARAMASEPYAPEKRQLPDWVKKIDYDAYQKISFNPEFTLWRKEGLPFRARFFHLGLYFHDPVQIREVDHGRIHPIRFSADMFTYGKAFEPPTSGDLGFAGFRAYARPDFDRDFFSFLGASYFRAVGASKQYGLSARGIAVNTGMPQPEEFPRFTTFWLARPAENADSMMFHALLDGPSITGAYTFVVTPGEERTVMDVDAHLFARRAIERIGVAPMTSMYRHGENDRRVSDDFRPEIHDSDGLAIWTGTGEWIWRPLTNPPFVHVNSFQDRAPRGFGFLQRDRDFENYQDDGAYYDRRPSLWVETLGDWGEGAVQLVEIPAADETMDNVVAFWNPATAVHPGTEMVFRYRLHWGAQPPVRPGGGEVIATRSGAGGIPGKKDTVRARKFVIDFKGGKLGELTLDDAVEPVITVSRGRVLDPAARPIRELGGWRSHFDIAAEGDEPVDLRLYLRGEEGALTETWLYYWIPE